LIDDYKFDFEPARILVHNKQSWVKTML